MVPDSDFDRHTSLKDKLSRIFDGHVVVNTFTVRAKNKLVTARLRVNYTGLMTTGAIVSVIIVVFT